jgi:hypothetical protein
MDLRVKSSLILLSKWIYKQKQVDYQIIDFVGGGQTEICMKNPLVGHRTCRQFLKLFFTLLTMLWQIS